MKKSISILACVLLVACSNISTQTYHGKTGGLNDPQEVPFHAKEGQKLTAELTTPQAANLRINQIISPSGVTDGPFGTDIAYDMTETGEWKLVIGGSLMQGDDYAGDFTVEIRLE
jgi:hypothetical protein